MKKQKSKKLQLDQVVIRPLDEKVLEHVTGGAPRPNHENSIVPTARSCCF